MANDDTESKDIAPTAKRMRDLRRKGQVAASAEFAGDLVLLIVVILSLFTFNSFAENFLRMFDGPLGPWQDEFSENLALNLPYIYTLFARSVFPVMVLVVFIIFIANIIDKQGIPASGENLSPKFERLNPVEGFKRVFSLRSIIELVKSLIKAAILLFAITIVITFLANDIVWSPSCGLDCVSSMAGLTLYIILVIGALLALISALVDLPVARFLFKRDNMMSKSDLKREQKEEFGAPELRKERNRLRQLAAAGSGVGFNRSTFLVRYDDSVVGLRFVRGFTMAPGVVGKAYGDDAKGKIAEAKVKGIPILTDQKVTENLMRYGNTGSQVPPELFADLIRVMRSGGLL